MARRYVFLCLLLAALLVVGLSGVSVGAADQQKLLVPDFALPGADGELVRFSDYRGQVVILNFWASWCPPCRAEMDELQELHDELLETGQSVLLLLNQVNGRQETRESGTNYLEKNGLTLTNLFDEGEVAGQIFGIPGLPTTVVIDAEGYFSSYVVGATTTAILKQMIEEAR